MTTELLSTYVLDYISRSLDPKDPDDLVCYDHVVDYFNLYHIDEVNQALNSLIAAEKIIWFSLWLQDFEKFEGTYQYGENYFLSIVSN